MFACLCHISSGSNETDWVDTDMLDSTDLSSSGDNEETIEGLFGSGDDDIVQVVCRNTTYSEATRSNEGNHGVYSGAECHVPKTTICRMGHWDRLGLSLIHI